MTFFQVQGICRVRKRFFGLSWYTYEPYYDDRLLPEQAANNRMMLLKKGESLPEHITRLERLHVQEIQPGSYVDAGQRIDFCYEKYHFTRF